jgi:hypothetical protein
VRRELFVFVDAAQNVAQSRVLGLANGLQDAALELAVARDEKITYQHTHSPHPHFLIF